MDIAKKHFAGPLIGPDGASGQARRAVSLPGLPQLPNFSKAVDFFIPAKDRECVEEYRRARLLAGFGIMGFIFGLAFGGAFFWLRHFEGVKIIAVCSAVFFLIPWLLKSGMGLYRLGNLYSLVLLGGFLSLCWVEGGMNGHALAWLVSVPLCALLLAGMRYAVFWGVVTFLSAAAVGGVEFFGISPPVRYPHEWHVLITVTGYLGLVLFMFLLGVLFERGRKRAFHEMQIALDDLESANGHLKRLNQEKNEFLSIAAHDLKNPLTIVMGMSEMLGQMEAPAPEDLKDCTEAISNESRRMRDLIANLLDLNAIEEGRMNLTMDETDLVLFADWVCENFSRAAANKGIRLDYIPSKIDAKVRADSQAVMQILDNLVSNAIKFSKPGTMVSVRVTETDRTVRVEVSDQGPGISEADQKKLFQRFSRLSNKPTGGENSTGLGLSIVKRLATSMNGDVVCESRVGEGTTFCFELPKTETSLS